MRSIRGALPALLLSAGAAVAQVPEGPCAAIKTSSLPPCDATAPAKAGPALATVDGADLSAGELDPGLRKRMETVDAAVADARLDALKAEIADVRLHLEAARRGTSFRDFWEAEVLKKTPAASDADLKAEFDRVKKWYPDKTFADLRPRLESVVNARNRKKREADLAASLAERFPATAGPDPGLSGLAPDAVLTTVGGRTITALSAATRLDAAAFSVRRDLHYEVLEALETAAGERLLKAEADRRGTTPEALLKEDKDAARKVTEGKPLSYHLEAPQPPTLALDLAGAASRGLADAPVTVVEYADFECPHCAKGWDTAEEALKPYGDRVRYVLRNYPLSFHENALKAAEAARAAGAQGRFFEMAALLFHNQDALGPASLKAHAARAGCEATRFAADLDGGRYTADVLLEERDGERIGVVATPMFFVNGVWLRWESTDVKGIRAAVDAALARAGATPPPAPPPKSAAR